MDHHSQTTRSLLAIALFIGAPFALVPVASADCAYNIASTCGVPGENLPGYCPFNVASECNRYASCYANVASHCRDSSWCTLNVYANCIRSSQCDTNIASNCDFYGNCAVNVLFSQCEHGGDCTVNAWSYCSSGCFVNVLSTCTTTEFEVLVRDFQERSIRSNSGVTLLP